MMSEEGWFTKLDTEQLKRKLQVRFGKSQNKQRHNIRDVLKPKVQKDTIIIYFTINGKEYRQVDSLEFWSERVSDFGNREV